MNLRTAILFFLAIGISMPIAVLSQDRPHAILTEFVSIPQKKGIMLSWTISGGFQCNGTRVYRSADGVRFEEIADIGGICGSVSEDVTYTHIDTVPLRNAYNHYRLEMGGQGFTKTISSYHVDAGSDGHARLTNSADGTVKLLFSNSGNRRVILEVLDALGNPVHADQTNGDSFVLQTADWETGVYIYRITGTAKGDVVRRMMVGSRW